MNDLRPIHAIDQVIAQDSPGHGQVQVLIDGEWWRIEHADYQAAVFTLIRARGQWDSDDRGRVWVFEDPQPYVTLFTGEKVCRHCLHHHGEPEDMCPPARAEYDERSELLHIIDQEIGA